MEGRRFRESSTFLDGDEKRFFFGVFLGLWGYLSLADHDPVLTSLVSGLGEREWIPPNLKLSFYIRVKTLYGVTWLDCRRC